MKMYFYIQLCFFFQSDRFSNEYEIFSDVDIFFSNLFRMDFDRCQKKKEEIERTREKKYDNNDKNSRECKS